MSKPSFFGKLKPPHRATASQQAIPATSSHLSPPQIKLPSEDLLNEDNNKKAGNQESSLNPKEKSGRRLSNSPSSFRLRRHSALELPQDIDVTTKYHTTHSKTPTSVKGTISFSCFPSFSVYSIPTASRFWRSWFLFENMLNILHIFLIPLMTGWTSHFINWGLVVYFVLIDFISLLDCIFSSLVIIKDNYGLYIVVPQELQSLYFSDRYNIFRLILCVPIELLVFVPVASPGLFPTMAASNESLLQYQFQLWAIMKFIRFFLRFPYKKIYELKIPGIALVGNGNSKFIFPFFAHLPSLQLYFPFLSSKPISRLIKTMLILMTLGHIDACIFWFLDNCIQGPGRWIDTYNLVTDPTTGLPVDFTTQYLDSYLTAVRSLVLKIRVVEKNPENVYVLLEFICGILSYGTVFGTIHSIVEMLDTSVLSTHAGKRLTVMSGAG